jgi:acyl carrier protein
VEHLTDLIKRQIARVAHVDVGEIDDDVLLFPALAPDLGIDVGAPDVRTNPNVSLDSLDILDMLVALEETFGVRYSLSDLETRDVSPQAIATPARIAEFILRTVPPADIEAGLRARRSS